MQHFQRHTSEDSSYLQVLNKKDLPFKVERIFFVNSSSNRSCTRGGHAHRDCEQLLVCLSGQITINLLNSKGESTVTLEEGQEYYHPKMEWADITFNESNSILLSLCSLEYLEKDYIRDKEEFLSILKTEN